MIRLNSTHDSILFGVWRNEKRTLEEIHGQLWDNKQKGAGRGTLACGEQVKKREAIEKRIS